MRLRNLCLLTFLALSGLPATLRAQAQYAFRISFVDKTGSPPLTAAATWLSPRALQRRAAFNIPLDSTDRPVSPRYIDSVLQATGGKLHVTSRWLNTCVILTDDSADALLLAGKPFLATTEYVGCYNPILHRPAGAAGPLETPAEPAWHASGKETGLSAYYGASWGQTDMVHGDCLHDQGYTGKGKLIAVLDAGFSNADQHPMFDSLYATGRLADQWNFLRNSDSVYGYSLHGTSVLSTMAGKWPGQYIGSAPDASYALYVTEDPPNEQMMEMDNMVAAFERADSLGADIIHSSLGYNEFYGCIPYSFPKTMLDGHTTFAARAANQAVAKGIFVVNSAGNEGGNSWDYLLTPADADSVLAVGAVNASRLPWANSSPGPSASGRVKPDVCLQGDPAFVAGYNDAINPSAGTSFAAPQVSGFVACLLQAAPSATPYRIRTAIQRSADAYNNPTAKAGYGIPDFCLALPAAGLGANRLEFATTSLTLYPNPAQDRVQIAWTGSGQWLVSLLDMTGKTLLRTTVQSNGSVQHQLRLPAALPDGLYVVRISGVEGTAVARFRKATN